LGEKIRRPRTVMLRADLDGVTDIEAEVVGASPKNTIAKEVSNTSFS
jgi:hypothetical protein